MDNLFCNLFRWAHRQDENFLTEGLVFVARYLLRVEPDIGRAFVGWLCFGQEHGHPFERGATITTQFSTNQGRPDLRIEAPGVLCLVEVKKESVLGETQLKRYRRVLNRATAPVRQLVLLTVYAAVFEDEAERPDHHVRWSDVASWLRKQRITDVVARFLVEQFLGFLQREVTIVEQVSWELLNGVKALRNLVTMIGRALELANLPGTATAGQKWFGYDVDGNNYWAGVTYETPHLVTFHFEGAREDPQKVKTLGPDALDQRGRPYFVLDLNTEATHFFARSADSQLALLKEFFERAHTTCRALLATQNA